MATIHHLGFLKTGICNSVYSSESICIILQNFVFYWSNHCWDMAIFRFFFQNGAVCHLDLFEPPMMSIWWHLSLCKIWNWCSSHNNMQLLIFNEFGLKMPIHAPNGGFWGILFPKLGAISPRPQKAPSCAETHHTTYSSLRLVHPFLHSSAFYPIPEIICFAMGQTARHSPKSAPSHWSISTSSNTWFLGFTRPSIPNGISIG